MNIVDPQVGIDVSKLELMSSIDQAKPFALKNNLEGCMQLVSRLTAGAVVHIEATGGYERLVHRTLENNGFKVVLHNPLNTRRMAQAQGTRAKTDPVDAKALSRDGAKLPEGSLKPLELQRLADHSRAIDELQELVAGLKKRLSMPELDEQAAKMYQQAINDLKKTIEEAKKAFDKRIVSSSRYEHYKLAMSVPAVGVVTARVLVCELPEDFLQRTAAQIASYSGLAPIDNSSGKRTGKAHLARGNSRIKKALYMPAICAIRTQPWARELYAKLRAKGKQHQSAVVAVMRRILVRVLAVMKRGTTWQVEPQNS